MSGDYERQLKGAEHLLDLAAAALQGLLDEARDSAKRGEGEKLDGGQVHAVREALRCTHDAQWWIRSLYRSSKEMLEQLRKEADS